MTEPEVLASWEVPHPDSLTLAQLDEVLELTGIDIAAMTGNGGSRVAGKVIAALVTWTRRRNGEQVDFDTVYQTMRTGQVRLSTPDPTRP